MIGFISGKAKDFGDDTLLITTGEGVGYVVSTIKNQKDTILGGKDDIVELYTHLIARDNSVSLIGFLDKESLNMFKLLISVSRIGPKIALGILNNAPTEELLVAIASEDRETLTKGYGIGKKSAERLILELQGKIDKETGEKGTTADVLAALITLGYGKDEARGAIREIKDKNGELDVQIREALSILSKM